jgi:hypothetical protein
VEKLGDLIHINTGAGEGVLFGAILSVNNGAIEEYKFRARGWNELGKEILEK